MTWLVLIPSMILVLDRPSRKPVLFVFVAFVGMALGASIALARAWYADFIPVAHEAEFYGVYHFAGKVRVHVGLPSRSLVCTSAVAVYQLDRYTVVCRFRGRYGRRSHRVLGVNGVLCGSSSSSRHC